MDAYESIRYWLVGCQSLSKLARRRKAQKSTGSTTAQNGTRSDGRPEAFRKWEEKGKTSKKEWKWQRGIVEHPLSESQWRKWESEKHKSWSTPAEGFKGHVATDGSLLENAGKWGGMWLGSGAVGFR